MRRKSTNQLYLDWNGKSTLKVVQEYRSRYGRIDGILKENGKIVSLAHRDLAKHLSTSSGGREAKYTSEEILRALLVMFLEGDSYRGVVVRIEESDFLRGFVGLGIKPMIDYTFLSKAFGCLSPETWDAINGQLTMYAVKQKKVSGEKLRVDTTAIETNIHYPTDASLLWDSYRTLVRILRHARAEYSWICAENRFHDRKTKRRYSFISRNGKSQSRRTQRKVKTAYRELIDDVKRVLEISKRVAELLGKRDLFTLELFHYHPLVEMVIDQAERRVFDGEMLPADEKLYSLFEEHTELIIRGKARKPVEFGHKVFLAQTKEKYISQYRVIEAQTADKDLLKDFLEAHETTFDGLPKVLAADKGFYESAKALRDLEERIETVSIAKKGRRTTEETEREHTKAFRLGQRFRAGIEGAISVLKRGYKLGRCLFKGFSNFASSIGCAVFCHNLVVLTRA